jgi:O-antigen ligase
MWSHGYDFLKENPFVIFTGVGYGEALVGKVTGITFYESSFYQAFLEMGILGALLLLAHLIMIIYYVVVGMKREEDRLKIWIFKAYAYFMPGFILSNIFGANMLQTDFIAPIFYGFLAVCYYVHDLNSAEKTYISNPS